MFRKVAPHVWRNVLVTTLACLSLPATRPGLAQTNEGWKPLFNGQNLNGWYTYLPSQGVNNDPNNVFKVQDGVLHILDVPDTGGNQEFGYVATVAPFENYRLRLQYKWGTKKFAPRADEKRSSGLLYHFLSSDSLTPRACASQIQEGDTGDFIALGGTRLNAFVASLALSQKRYYTSGPLYMSENTDVEQILKDAVHDTTDGWNTVEVVATGTEVAHIVNGQVNFRGSNLRQPYNPEIVYVSDLTPVSASNGWGPVEKDTSLGEDAPYDGRFITINGTQYSRGLGMAPFNNGNAEVVYRLDGKYTTFRANVGVDDEVGSNGSVSFEVWADGVKLASTPQIRGSQPAVPIQVNVTGRRELRLVVTNGGDGYAYDHADWGDASLVPHNGPVPTSSLPFISSVNHWGPIERNMSLGEQLPGDGNPLRIAGKSYATGLGMAPGVGKPAEATIYLGGNYSTFSAEVGVDDETNGQGLVCFEVWADGVKLAGTDRIAGGQPAVPIQVDVTGRQELRLVVKDGGNGNSMDHADWGDAVLTLSEQATTPLTRGRIVLQAEGAEVMYRNIEILPLSFTPPPAGATVLYDGTDTTQWKSCTTGDSVPWLNYNGNLEVVPLSGDIETKAKYQDFRMHIEWKSCETPHDMDPQRAGNSGIFLQGRYELAVLDSFGKELGGMDDAGSLYGVKDASANVSVPAGTWNSYDIEFRAARWNGNTKVENARATVYWNGVKVHDNVQIPYATQLGKPEGPTPGPIRLQEFQDAVCFRNIWIQPLN